MDTLQNQEYLRRQYEDSRNLGARIDLHTRFSTEEHPWFHWVFDRFEIPENARILELGCGTGLLWSENLPRIPHGWRITLSDASPGMVREAEEGLRHTALGFTFAEVNAVSIPYDNDTFDSVIANHMLYHVPDLDRALSEIRRVLKPGGRPYATTVGLNHMTELRRVPRDLGIRTPDGSVQTFTQFNLDNSASDLGHWFAEVELERRNGTLMVTEATPLVDYVLSGTRLSDEEALRLRASFDSEIQLKGAFRIGTETGIFKAIRES